MASSREKKIYLKDSILSCQLCNQSSPGLGSCTIAAEPSLDISSARSVHRPIAEPLVHEGPLLGRSH